MQNMEKERIIRSDDYRSAYLNLRTQLGSARLLNIGTYWSTMYTEQNLLETISSYKIFIDQLYMALRVTAVI
jgi:hypothetical protein